jgi:hypothetical protein
MDKEILGPVGAVVLGFIWIFWRLEWRLDNIGARWDSLPLLEKLVVVAIVVGWTLAVEIIAWYGRQGAPA